MDDGPEDKLKWPPDPDDLRRLYLEDHLSAAKIAERYGLKYASPKTAESTVLYHLKKNGISRRDKAEHTRRVTEEMVDAWVKRYEAGESLKQIAGEEINHVTVFNHLRKRGLQLRDKVEAQIKAVTRFQRVPFSGDFLEKSYVLGFVWGDCSVEKHGRATRVRSGTTHPDFAGLFEELFASYGRIRYYPKYAKVAPAEWNLEVDLHGSFEFLQTKNIQPFPDELGSSEMNLQFMAGLVDAEGSIYFHHRGYTPAFEFQISNTNLKLLKWVETLLLHEGYHPRVHRGVKKVVFEHETREFEIWVLALYRFEEVRRILTALPLRHKEKVTKAKLALSFMNSETKLDSEGSPEGWREYLLEVERGRIAFIQEALNVLSSKESGVV